MDVNEELEFLRKFKKKIIGVGGQVGGSGWCLVRVDVNIMLGVGGGCEHNVGGRR